MKLTSIKDIIVWFFAALVILYAFIFVYQRGQDLNWDLLNYHYFAGYSLLHSRFFVDIAPVNLQSFLNPSVNILAYLPLAHLAFPWSAWVILVVQLLSIPILVLITRQIGRELGYPQFGLAEFLALTLCILAPLWWSELGTTFFSSTTTPIILLGLYLGLRCIIKEKEASNLIIISGLLFGLASGLKLTNAPFAVGFFAALAVVSTRSGWKHSIWQLLKFSSGMLIGFSVTAWWNLYLNQSWESPLFPLYNAWLKSPYFDQTNWRDMRWHFSSVTDFGRYILAAANGTVKTSEVLFADARLIIFLVIAPLLLLVKKTNTMGKGILFFLLFFGVSFFLWCVMFAYQRYLIPIEVLVGLVIWMLLSRLNLSYKQVSLLLTGCVIASATFIKVPDWGHNISQNGQPNPFGLQLPIEVTSTPARYLVVGAPIGYILPFLHPDSRYYGIGFSSQVDALIRSKVSENVNLPLRILSNEDNIFSIWNTLSTFGFVPQLTNLNCQHFRSNIGKYVICEISRRSQEQAQSSPPIEIDFQSTSGLLPSAVLGFKGLSGPEPWGRWSDTDEVVFQFANCLPMGKLIIKLRGHAFGPNIGIPVKVTFGHSKTSLIFPENDRDITATLENHEQCVNTLSILVPKKTSPSELGLSQDTRQLGIGLAKLNIQTLN